MSGRGWIRGSNMHSRGGFRGRGGRGKPWHGDRGPQRFQPYDNTGDRRRHNQPWKNKIQRETPGKRLSEKDIGVTEYISDYDGFNGIIKSRYSDFQVSEISLTGAIAKLTNMSPPEPPVVDDVHEDEDLLLCKYNLEILPMDTWDRINKLVVCTEPTAEKVEIDVTGMSKEQRTKIHEAVKKAFAEAVVGSTVTTEDKKYVCFQKYRKGIHIDNRVKWVWPGEYVHFIVHKENCDTMEAASKIADRLKLVNVKPSMLGYAGTKDRRAKTTQWFSLRRVEPKKIAASCRDMREIQVGNFSFSATPLALGDLRGNRFRIALRNVTGEEADIEAACLSLREKGFINYYGLQRFGTRADSPTYEVGRKLMQGKYKEAIDSILEEREGPLQEALHIYATTGDAFQACRAMGRHQRSTVEGRLLTALANHPFDLVGALGKLPRNMRLLYTHSYQSLIWNRCVSERIQRLGCKASAGDLVLLAKDASDHTLDLPENDDSETEEADNNDEIQDGGEETQNGEKVEAQSDKPDTPNRGKQNNKKYEPKPKIPVKVLTQEDVASGKYSLGDVVLPLPGFNVDYPPNVRDRYEQLLADDGLSTELRSKIKAYSMSGAYRHLLVTPRDVTWSSVRYSEPFGDLILSDRDELNETQLTSIVPDGKYKALLLTLSLPASCYATMALRELLKVDTSGDNQAKQNNYHKEKPQTAPEQNDTTEGDKSEIGEKRKLKEEDEGEAKKVKVEVDTEP